MFNNVKSNDLIKKNKTCSEFSSFNSFISNDRNKTVELSVVDLKNFKNLLKRENLKKLNKYREDLDKKIELLKDKLYRKDNNKIIKEENENIENNKITIINYKKFIETYILNKNIFLRITNFLDTNDLYRLFTLNNEIHQGIILNLTEISKEKIIPNYIIKYNNDILFKESKFFLIFKKYKKNKKMNLRIIFTIKSKH
jgi:hypothetical protein